MGDMDIHVDAMAKSIFAFLIVAFVLSLTAYMSGFQDWGSKLLLVSVLIFVIWVIHLLSKPPMSK